MGNVPYVFDNPAIFRDRITASIEFDPASDSTIVIAGNTLSCALPTPDNAVGNIRYEYSLPSGASQFGHGFQWTPPDRGVSRYSNTASVVATDNVGSTTFTLHITINEI